MDGIAKKGDTPLFRDKNPLKQVTSKIKAFFDYNLLGRNQWGGAFWLLVCCYFICVHVVCLGFFKHFPHKLPRRHPICC